MLYNEATRESDVVIVSYEAKKLTSARIINNALYRIIQYYYVYGQPKKAGDGMCPHAIDLPIVS